MTTLPEALERPRPGEQPVNDFPAYTSTHKRAPKRPALAIAHRLT